MRRVFFMIIILIILYTCVFAISNAADYVGMQMQQQQQQPDDSGGDFTRIVTTEGYYNQMVPAGYGNNNVGDSWGTPDRNTNFGQFNNASSQSGFSGQASSGNPPNIQIVTEATDPVKRCAYYTRDNAGHQVFKIRVYIAGPDLSRIKSVKYILHQTFDKPDYISTDASSNFEMILWSWGRFTMPVTITTIDGNEYQYMYPFTFRAQLENAQRSGYRFIDATGAWDVIGGY